MSNPSPSNRTYGARSLLFREMTQEALYEEDKVARVVDEYRIPREASDQGDSIPVDDKDVARMEDRISASEERSQLRLDVAMAHIEGKLDGLSSVTNAIRDQGRETRNIVIGSVFVILFGVLGILVGLKQVWIGGVQVGQAIPHSSSDLSPVGGATQQRQP